jgi:hypothetical protein
MAIVAGVAPVLVCGCLAAQAQTASGTTTNPAAATATPPASAAAPVANASAPKAAKPIPPNTIDCKDWHRNPDNTWTASKTAKPFDLASVKNIKFAGRSTEHYSTIYEEDIDLWEVLEAKCGAQGESKAPAPAK